jgi:hypothetical protein
MWVLLLLHFNYGGESAVVAAQHAVYPEFNQCVTAALEYNEAVEGEKSTGVCVKAKVYYPGMEPKVRF